MSSNTVLEEEDEIKMKMIQSTAHTHRRVAMTNCGGRMRIAMESENWKKKRRWCLAGWEHVCGMPTPHRSTQRRHDYRRYGVESVLSADATEQSRINSQHARDKNLTRASRNRQ